jgi:hypothetical protein
MVCEASLKVKQGVASIDRASYPADVHGPTGRRLRRDHLLIRATLTKLIFAIIVVALSGCESPADVECRESVFCERWGACAEVDRESDYDLGGFFCGPTKQEHCEASTWTCQQDGQCTLRDGECVAVSDDECEASSLACAIEGRCSARGGRCVASGDDCAEALICKAHKACTAFGGECGFSREQKVEMFRRGSGRPAFLEREDLATSLEDQPAEDAPPCERTDGCLWAGRCERDGRDCVPSEDVIFYACLSSSAKDMLYGEECFEATTLSTFDISVAEHADAEQMAILCRQHCKRDGRCTVNGGECVATLDFDCRRSQICDWDDRCTAIDGVCRGPD